MRRIKASLTAICLLVGGMLTNVNATNTGDTLVIENPSKVKIETRDTVQRIVIDGSKDDPSLQYIQRISIPDTSAVRRKLYSVHDFNKIKIKKKDGKESNVSLSLHFMFGLNTMTGAPDGYDFRLWPSIDFGMGVGFDWKPLGKHHQFSTGLGFEIQNYKTPSNRYWTKDEHGSMVLVPFDEALTGHKSSSLSVLSMQVPLLYTYTFDDKGRWAITAGGILKLNSASATRRYKYDGEDYNVSTEKTGVRPFTVEGIVILRAPYIPSIYCKYCPMTFFRDGRGPKMHQLSFGFFF